MSLPRQIQPSNGSVVREAQTPLAILQERYRTAKNEYDATRGGESNSFTKEQRKDAKQKYESARKAVNAGLAEDKKLRKGGKSEAAPMPAAIPAPTHGENEHRNEPMHAPEAGNMAGIGTRYQTFPAFRGPETPPFLDGYWRP
jgi:hypothetical protein